MSTEEELLAELRELDKLWRNREDELGEFMDGIISAVERKEGKYLLYKWLFM